MIKDQGSGRRRYRPHHHVGAVGGIALVDGELTRQNDDVAHRQAEDQTGDQRRGEVRHREDKARAEQQRRHAKTDTGLYRAADIEDPYQRPFDDAGERKLAPNAATAP